MSAGLRVGVSSGHGVWVMGESSSGLQRVNGFISQRFASKGFGLGGRGTKFFTVPYKFQITHQNPCSDYFLTIKTQLLTKI